MGIAFVSVSLFIYWFKHELYANYLSILQDNLLTKESSVASNYSLIFLFLAIKYMTTTIKATPKLTTPPQDEGKPFSLGGSTR